MTNIRIQHISRQDTGRFPWISNGLSSVKINLKSPKILCIEVTSTNRERLRCSLPVYLDDDNKSRKEEKGRKGGRVIKDYRRMR